MKQIANILMLFLFSLFCQTTEASEKAVAKCVGDICIGGLHSKSARWLLREYGSGQVRKDIDDPGIVVHCYYDARQKLWIELEFSSSESGKANLKFTGLFVTSVSMCPTHYAAKKPFPDFVSELGVKIGLAESDIFRKMGPPKRTDDVKEIEQKSPYLKDSFRYSSKVGSNRLVYDDNPSSLLFNFYGLEKGWLVSMWFAERE